MKFPLDPDSLILAIDQGGHAGRAIVFDTSGRQVAQASRAVVTLRPETGRVEHDPFELVAATRGAIDDVCQRLGSDGRYLRAAGLATQRSSIVSWDRATGAPLSPVLSWQDTRGSVQVRALRDESTVVQEITGLVLSPHYGASKMRWCLDHLPATRAALTGDRLALGPLSSYLLYSLLSARPFVVDPANASRTQLWDVGTARWSPELCALFGVPERALPRSVRSRYAFGELELEATLLPLTVCTGDQAAALFAYGELREGTAYLNVGTGAFIQCLLPPAAARIAPSQAAPLQATPPGAVRSQVAPLLQSIAWWDSDENSRLAVMEGTVNGAGSALDWADERLSLDAHAAVRNLTFARVQSLNPPVFLNGVSGLGSPYWLPQFESRWLDDGGGHGELEKLVAVIESIAFLICANLEVMRNRCAGLRHILASGGLSASDYLCHCIACLGEIEVIRTGQPEMTAAGLAFLTAGMPASWRPSSQLAVFKPCEDRSLRTRHATWLTVMDREADLNPRGVAR